MTRDEIARMAHDVGFGDYAYEARSVFERFFHAAYEAGAAAEREALVAIINDNTDGDGVCCADDLLEAIRARGEK